MGKLIGGFLSVDNEQPFEIFQVGTRHDFKASSDGWLLLKINEPVGNRRDNSGSLKIQLQIQ
jgi:hypothetical protein